MIIGGYRSREAACGRIGPRTTDTPKAAAGYRQPRVPSGMRSGDDALYTPSPGLNYLSDRKLSQSSSEKDCGCSHAAKWPPFCQSIVVNELRISLFCPTARRRIQLIGIRAHCDGYFDACRSEKGDLSGWPVVGCLPIKARRRVPSSTFFGHNFCNLSPFRSKPRPGCFKTSDDRLDCRLSSRGCGHRLLLPNLFWPRIALWSAAAARLRRIRSRSTMLSIACSEIYEPAETPQIGIRLATP
jgi:hypothetical protein